MMKMTIPAPRRTGMTHDEFRTYLTEVHGPLVRREARFDAVPGVSEIVTRYVQNHVHAPNELDRGANVATWISRATHSIAHECR